MAKNEPWFTFDKQQLDALVPKLKEWLDNELELEATGLQVQLLLRYITEEVGIYYYDRGVTDAIDQITRNVEDLYALMKS